ncbi:MAG: dihydroorotate dehydrogenase-like protein [Deltaproteobacteria bacterium]|nr:dihydroorotate dehydrogenase-like protein [Deltaproteobacteria bacterium]MBI3388967.1 dihydroorotate dehydrogenase-like protein [Deltaproteobacteria bacterium]
MDLSTTYLGLKLPHPLMPGASPLVDDLDMVKRLEDAGAAAIVMHSLFEEQIEQDQLGFLRFTEDPAESYAEALSYFPRPDEFALGPERYLRQIQRIKETVAVPVIASLNGHSASGWLEYARLIEQAGADALELNIYHVPTDPTETGDRVEQRVLDIVRTVKAEVGIPLAVKLAQFFSAIPHLAHALDRIGTNGLVLFNRFYHPDIDIEELEVVPRLHLSEPYELLVRLRWLAILAGRVRMSLAVTGGVHTAPDAIKAVMAGAHAVQMVSALLLHGPEHLRAVHDAMRAWMEEHEYTSLAQMRGSMSLEHCPNPSAVERGNYLRVLQSWRGRDER